MHEILKSLPQKQPPRNYIIDGQIILEYTVDMAINSLRSLNMEVFR